MELWWYVKYHASSFLVFFQFSTVFYCVLEETGNTLTVEKSTFETPSSSGTNNGTPTDVPLPPNVIQQTLLETSSSFSHRQPVSLTEIQQHSTSLLSTSTGSNLNVF
jgi:hypothetical protein